MAADQVLNINNQAQRTPPRTKLDQVPTQQEVQERQRVQGTTSPLVPSPQAAVKWAREEVEAEAGILRIVNNSLATCYR